MLKQCKWHVGVDPPEWSHKLTEGVTTNSEHDEALFGCAMVPYPTPYPTLNQL